MIWAGLGAAALMAPLTGATLAEPPRLGPPVRCDFGKTCFIQSYVDTDPGPGVADFACGSASYAGHDGTDFRLLSAERMGGNVEVIAAAAGIVKGARDGMPDRVANPAERALIAGRECGNGVVLDHGAGWQTQYCHMKAGTVRVKPGALVEKGTVLGAVGLSGLTEFAHVHLTVRHNGKVIDPFSGAQADAACRRNADTAGGLWDDAFLGSYAYRAGEIIAAGFAGQVLDHAVSEIDDRAVPLEPESRQLVFYARFINLKAGDVVRLDVRGPGGFNVTNAAKPLDRNKATYLAFAGKKRRAELARWPSGTYEGRVEVVRGGAVVLEQAGRAEVP